MLQRSFEHWYRGASLAAAAASSTSPQRGFRGSLGTPIFRIASSYDASTSGGLAAGGSATPGIASAASSLGVLAAGGEASSTLSATCGGGGGLGLAWVGFASLGHRVEGSGGWSTAGFAPASAAFLAVGSGGVQAGGRADAATRHVALASGGWKAGGAGVAIEPPLDANSFAYWLRGRSITNSLGGRSGGFAHAYRGDLGLPSSVRVAGVAVSETASGGLAFGGAASAQIAHAARSSGGASPGGVALLRVGSTYAASAGASFGGHASSGLAILSTSAGGLGFGGFGPASRSVVVEPAGGLSVGGGFRSPQLGYRIYWNQGLGGPIDYDAPIAVTFDTTWTSAPLPPGSFFRFAVRALDAETGLQEENLDASLALIIDAEGRDATQVPLAPLGVRAIPLAGGRARIEWTVAGTTPARRATRFHVYVRPHVAATFGVPTAVVPANSARGDSFSVEVGGLTDGVSYAVSVRAANGYGEEANTRRVAFRADAAPPTQVDSLVAVASPAVA
jgi:hypothetical protein